MKVVRTPRAIEGFREVATYIANNFGNKALLEFRQRTKEWTELLKKNPRLGNVDDELSTDDMTYRIVIIYRRSIMVYRIDHDTIIVVDFYDTRHSTPSSILFE